MAYTVLYIPESIFLNSAPITSGALLIHPSVENNYLSPSIGPASFKTQKEAYAAIEITVNRGLWIKTADNLDPVHYDMYKEFFSVVESN